MADGGEHMEAFGGQDIVMALIKSWERILIGANPFDKEFILGKLNTSFTAIPAVLS